MATTAHSFATFKELVPEIQILLSKWTAWWSAQLRTWSQTLPRTLVSQVAAPNASLDTLQRQGRSMQTHLKQQRCISNPDLGEGQVESEFDASLRELRRARYARAESMPFPDNFPTGTDTFQQKRKQTTQLGSQYS